MTNPHLQVQVENGFYDMATPFYATEYTMDHLFLPGGLRNNIHFEYYGAGHMMYLHQEDLAKLKSNIAAFIDGHQNNLGTPISRLEFLLLTSTFLLTLLM